MKNKILTASLCLILIFSVAIATSGHAENAGREESLFPATALENNQSSEQSPVIVEREKNHPNKFHEINREIDLNKSFEGEDIGNSLDSGNETDGEEDDSNGGFFQGIQDFLGWAGSNIQDFLGWAGSNTWDFLAWAGSSMYSGLASLGRGSIILLLVVLLIAMVYASIKI